MLDHEVDNENGRLTVTPSGELYYTKAPSVELVLDKEFPQNPWLGSIGSHFLRV